MIPLTDLQEVLQAARMVPFDLRQAFLEQPGRSSFRGKILGDGLMHRVTYQVARGITWDVERTAAVG